MLLQTNAYSVPREKQDAHARLVKRFEQHFSRLGASFEVYQQVDENFADPGGPLRYVQIMRFSDLRQLQAVRSAESSDPACKALIAEFCELINLSDQMRNGSFIPGYYAGL
jgi:hypothetical protein